MVDTGVVVAPADVGIEAAVGGGEDGDEDTDAAEEIAAVDAG